MATLPIPPDTYFSDFAFSLQTYSIIRSRQKIGTASGLVNSEEGEIFIHFKLEAPIKPGDTLECDGDIFLVTKIAFDTYQCQKALLKAYVVNTI